MKTKISPHRTGEPRFGTRDPEPFDNSVKEFHLSTEELEEYRNGKKGGSKFMIQEDYEKLIKQGMTKQQIADKYGIAVQTLYNRIKAWKSNARKQQINPDSDEKKDTKVNELVKESSPKIAEYERQIEELKVKIAGYENINDLMTKDDENKQALLQQIDSDYTKLKSENETMKKEYGELYSKYQKYDVIIENQKYQLGQYAKLSLEQQEEIEHLKYFARRCLAV